MAPKLRPEGGSLLVVGRGVHGFELLAVEVEREFELVAAGVAEGEAELEVEGFGDGGGDGAGPANGEGLGCGVARLDGIREGPVEVDFLVDASDGGSAVEAGVGEVFALQAFEWLRSSKRGAWCAGRGVRHP